MTTKKTTPTAATRSGYTQQAGNTILHSPIIIGNGSTKSGTWLKKLRREYPVQWKKKMGTVRERIGCAWQI